MWTYFPVKKRSDLANLIFSRLKELGYGKDSNGDIINIALNCGNGALAVSDNSGENNRIAWTTDNSKLDHRLGDLNDLFLTDKYKVKAPLIKVKLANYTAEVTDVIRVGCETISGPQIEELYQAFKKYNS